MNENVNHGRALLWKAIMVFPVVWIILSLFNDVTFFHSTLLGIVLLLLSYYIGDMMVLPKMGNMTATLGDFVLSLIVIWGGLVLLGYREAFGEALFVSIVLAIGEYFYHLWLERTQFRNKADADDVRQY
ncbi:DUF2512 family protein [Siminovitchia sp. FSL H7-0308]|uniref:Cation transport ATPase n=1 Tax=Siminovitchia thermophila TaxID=1245522 RepID=A0ABS2RA58_9BACI|nr:DUF2512 family protein [Siminovitchia thermophila]MBM7716538.1 cation transport ATPase [Siminovitchia thermophila]ONK24123.1 hypothetical protein BLX87_06490 [Bacillus sp. VT-16-64]